MSKRQDKDRDKDRDNDSEADRIALGLAPGGSPLVRKIRVDGIRDGLEEIIEVNPAERSEIAKLQDLQRLDALSFAYVLRKVSGGSLRLKGRLKADAVQTCVVSLESVPAKLDLPVEAEFWPVSMIRNWRARADQEALEEAEMDWPEPIVDGVIDLGALIYETFATALDPYPRAEGAELDHTRSTGGGADDGNDAAGARQSPFAALERLKKR